MGNDNKYCEVTIVHEEDVLKAEEYLDTIDLTSISELGRLLFEENRLMIVYSLIKMEKLCVCDLSTIIGASMATTSHHLQTLKKEGVIESRREGRLSYYFLKKGSVNEIIDLMEKLLKKDEKLEGTI